MPYDLRTNLLSRSLNYTKLAQVLEVDKATVSRWGKKGVPVNHLSAVSEITGIPRHELRPDIFGPAPRLSKTRGSNSAVAV